MLSGHIRSEAAENWRSRPISHTQAVDRSVSTWVGDDQGILTVECF